MTGPDKPAKDLNEGLIPEDPDRLAPATSEAGAESVEAVPLLEPEVAVESGTAAAPSEIDDTEVVQETAGQDPTPEAMNDDTSPVADDPAPAPAAEPSTTPAQPVHAPAKSSGRGGFVALVLGGAIAAGAGFAASRYLIPEGWPLRLDASMTAAFEARIAAQEAALASLAARPVAEVGATDPALQQALEALAAAQTELTRLSERLAVLEARPAAPGETADPAALDAMAAEIAALQSALSKTPDVVAAMQAEVAALRSEIAAGPDPRLAEQIAALTAAAEAERAAAEAREAAARAEAEGAARAALSRAALLRVQAAVEGGGAFDAALADLASGGVAVPQALGANAAGIATIAELQATFPAAARAALAASVRVEASDGVMDRLGSFLRSQTGARSLTPRDGDGVDAILSRAEATLRSGDVGGTLTLIDTLPPEAVAAFAEWRVAAETRVSVADALAGLAAGLATD